MGCSHSIIGGSSSSCIDSKDGIRERDRDADPGAAVASASRPSDLANVRKSVKKMSWNLSLMFPGASALRRRRPRRRRRGEADDGLCGGDGGSSENNKSWLLAEARTAALVTEPQSVHSSFRFSFDSQVEAEGLPAAAATVLLLVNLEDGGDSESQKGEAHSQQLQHLQRLESLERSIAPVAGALLRFSYAEIRAATGDFANGRELGRGALSRVFRGRIGVRRRAVAIKRVEGQDRESAKAFCRELMIASSLRSPNVVPLIGFCVDREGLFLVYKFVSGGNLENHLHHHEKKGRRKVLPWEVRYKVAMGVARAVEYLHYGTDKCVVHRDIKPSNILLSSNKTPKLCDFGLATWTDGPSQPFLCKAVKGTFGYLAPEYFQHGKLSDKTDVYAFGVVLLELISGRKAIDRSKPPGDENLVVWAKPLLQQGEGGVHKLIDPRLKPGSYPWTSMSRMVHAATACINCEESRRPSIDQVIGMLQGEGSGDWSFFISNGCLAGYGSLTHHPLEKSDMRGHLALAMHGVSDTEEDDMYGC